MKKNLFPKNYFEDVQVGIRTAVEYIGLMDIHNFFGENQSQSKTDFAFAVFSSKRMMEQILFFFFGNNLSVIGYGNTKLVFLRTINFNLCFRLVSITDTVQQ